MALAQMHFVLDKLSGGVRIEVENKYFVYLSKVESVCVCIFWVVCNFNLFQFWPKSATGSFCFMARGHRVCGATIAGLHFLKIYSNLFETLLFDSGMSGS